MVYEREQEKLDIVKDHLILNRTLRINHLVMKKMKTAMTQSISTVTCRFPFPSFKQMFSVVSFFYSPFSTFREQIHYPSMCSYNMSDIFSDLVRFAAQTLVLGGHLVYWLPSIKKE